MVECGIGPGGLPYHRFGGDDQPLVLIPGVMDPLGWNDPSRLTAELLSRYYFRGFQEYDVWVLSRQPGLDAGLTVSELATQYGTALEAIGSAHVLGFSFGGFIAAKLAADRLALVDRLVLAMSGSRYGEYGREELQRWEQLAWNERWAAIHRAYARAVYSSHRRWLVLALYRLTWPLLPTPIVPADLQITLETARRYDGSRIFEAIEIPTLVVAGSADVLMPESLCRAGADALDDGYVTTVPAGHAAYEEQSAQFSSAVSSFLANSFEKS